MDQNNQQQPSSAGNLEFSNGIVGPAGKSTDKDVEALNTAFPTPAATERRAKPRLKYQVVATLEPVAAGEGADDVSVVTRDASENGTGYVSSRQLPEGSRAVLHLPDPNGGGDTQRIECRVRRSQELGNGLFEGSVEFMGEQTPVLRHAHPPDRAREKGELSRLVI